LDFLKAEKHFRGQVDAEMILEGKIKTVPHDSHCIDLSAHGEGKAF